MSPIILEATIRVEPLWLVVACGVLAIGVLGLALAIPLVRAQARCYGRAGARPDLVAALARMSGRWQAKCNEARDLRLDLAEVRGDLARLRGAVAGTWVLAQEPTEEERRLVLMNGRRG